MSKLLKIDGNVWKPVTCQHCDEQFVYKMNRNAKVEIADLEDKAQKKTATEQAKLILKHRFKEEFDEVPCPGCGRFQQNMVWAKRYRVLPLAEGFAYATTLMSFIFIAFAILLSFAEAPDDEFMTMVATIAKILVPLIPTMISVILFCYIVRILKNPNRKPQTETAAQLVKDGVILDKNTFKAAASDKSSNTGMILGASALFAFSAFQLHSTFADDSTEENLANNTEDTLAADALADDMIASDEGAEATEVSEIADVDANMDMAMDDLDAQIDSSFDEMDIEISDSSDLIDDILDNT